MRKFVFAGLVVALVGSSSQACDITFRFFKRLGLCATVTVPPCGNFGINIGTVSGQQVQYPVYQDSRNVIRASYSVPAATLGQPCVNGNCPKR